MKLKYLIPAIVLIIIAGCFTSKKADKALNKVMNKFPDKVAAYTRDHFPCNTLPSHEITNTVTIKEASDTVTRDSLIYIKCPEKGDSVKIKVQYYDINHHIDTTRTITITHPFEDSAKIKLANYATQQANTEIITLKSKLQTKGTSLWMALGIIVVLAAIVLFTIKKLTSPKKL